MEECGNFMWNKFTLPVVNCKCKCVSHSWVNGNEINLKIATSCAHKKCNYRIIRSTKWDATGWNSNVKPFKFALTQFKKNLFANFRHCLLNSVERVFPPSGVVKLVNKIFCCVRIHFLCGYVSRLRNSVRAVRITREVSRYQFPRALGRDAQLEKNVPRATHSQRAHQTCKEA